MRAMEHITDDEIDLYVAGKLSEDAERGVELHYLECAACLARVTTLQDVAQALRPAKRPARRLMSVLVGLAAGVAAFGFGFALRGRVDPASPSLPAVSPGIQPAQATSRPATGSLRFLLQAPERGAGLRRLRIPEDVELVLFSVDSREIASLGTTVTASLVNVNGREVLVLRDLPLDAESRVLLPIPAAALRPGAYVVLLAAPSGDTLKIPLDIETSRAR